MNEMLKSLKSDLLDRRLLPILIALGVLLAGAVAFVVLAGGGGGEAGVPAAAVGPRSAPVAPGPNLAVTQAPATNPHAAVAETTVGGRYQHKPGRHNPFTPLSSPKAKSSSTTTTSFSSSSSHSSSSTGSGLPRGERSAPSAPPPATGGGETTPTAPAKPAPKPRVKTVYLVSVQFGPLPTAPGVAAKPVPYSKLERLAPLPSKDDERLVLAGARHNGKGAVFELSREAILKGQGVCIPSASQCEAILLEVGQTEELTYLEPDGSSAPYELKVVSIEKTTATATAARVHHRHRGR